MTLNRIFLRGIVAGFFLCLTGSMAFGAPRTWVSGSSTASDSGTCPRTAPCATFAYALRQTNAGGEVDVLDSGDFGFVDIRKSVSIVADGVLGGILVPSCFPTPCDAIFVSVGANDVVVLRGLTLNGVGTGGRGINFSAGGVLHVENCTISNFAIGIAAYDARQVFIKDTIVRNNGNVGIQFAPFSANTTASLDNVRAEDNSDDGILVQTQTSVTVSMRNSVIAGNGTGISDFASSTGHVINLESSIVSGNSSDGISSDGANSTINITNVTVVKNGTGLSETNGGHIVSFGNNKVTDNTTNGSPTKTIAQK
jgi:hypothetical protein